LASVKAHPQRFFIVYQSLRSGGDGYTLPCGPHRTKAPPRRGPSHLAVVLVSRTIIEGSLDVVEDGLQLVVRMTFLGSRSSILPRGLGCDRVTGLELGPL
jgi:hypothetical protein